MKTIVAPQDGSHGFWFNVSHSGNHIFSTNPRSCPNEDQARMLWEQMKQRFPVGEGWVVQAWERQPFDKVADFK